MMDFSILSPEMKLLILFSFVFVFAFVIVFAIQINIKSSKTKTKTKVSDNKQSITGSKNISINGVNGNVSITSADNLENGENDEITTSDVDYNVNILFIDDEPKSKEEFQMIKLLSSYGFSNTHLLNDAIVTAPEVCNARIIFVDITGVGKIAGCKEGTELAVQIKKRYGNSKIVAIYSSTETHNIQVKGLQTLDNIFGKNDDSQIYIDFIEQYAKRN